MKKLILNWLFGTDNMERYIDLLGKSMNHNKECTELIEGHLKTLREEKDNLEIIRKLIKICENHGINADKEIKQVKL